jgi:hypothetical protein
MFPRNNSRFEDKINIYLTEKFVGMQPISKLLRTEPVTETSKPRTAKFPIGPIATV